MFKRRLFFVVGWQDVAKLHFWVLLDLGSEILGLQILPSWVGYMYTFGLVKTFFYTYKPRLLQ